MNSFWKDVTSSVSKDSILRLLLFGIFLEHENSNFAMCTRYPPCILGKHITEVLKNLSNFSLKLFS